MRWTSSASSMPPISSLARLPKALKYNESGHQILTCCCIEKRKVEAMRILKKFPDRIPVICEKVEKSDIQEIDKRKYLVPSDLTVGQFVYVIRKRIQLPPEKAIFIFIKDILPPTAALMSSIYEEHKDEDGFLYVLYSGENTFGEPLQE